MSEVIAKIIPYIVILIVGIILKKTKLLTTNDADRFLKLNFYFLLPALLLASLTSVELKASYVLLPVSAVCIIAVISIISYLSGKWMRLPDNMFGVFIIGCMIMNVGFLLPFVSAVWGEEGLARIAIFDIVNGILTFTLMYAIAVKFGNGRMKTPFIAKKLLLSPPLWAILIGIIFNLASIQLPTPMHTLLSDVGKIALPIIMLSLGVYLNTKFIHLRATIVGLVIRMGIGALLGYVCALLFGATGLTRDVIILASAAPIGYNTLTFASLEHLDKEYAASFVSASVIVGIIYTTLFLVLL